MGKYKDLKVVEGKYSNALVYTNNIDDKSINQLKELCDQSFTEGSKIRVMPDVHAGKGCVIGFTADLGDKVIPNIVGVDIGCGMLTVKLGKDNIDMELLDRVIREKVPSGFSVHGQSLMDYSEVEDLRCSGEIVNKKRIEASIGTLGGGNHFIEVAMDSKGDKYLIIHTGSRNLGKQVADIYQNKAIEALSDNYEEFKKQKVALIKRIKDTGDPTTITNELDLLEGEFKAKVIPKHLAYLTGEDRADYLHDMTICLNYARLNRLLIADTITNNMFNREVRSMCYFETIHNYIDTHNNIIRKGAISADKGELVLIPINMRDGSILAKGKGNEDWNKSAPHGAGRLMSRTSAKSKISMGEFKESMKGVWTTSVKEETLDEAPMAYKPIDDIIGKIGDTVDIIDILKPIYNYKDN